MRQKKKNQSQRECVYCCNPLLLLLFQYIYLRTYYMDGIATAYGLEVPGIESRWGEIFRISPDRP